MSRYLLDTNIVIFLLLSELDNISDEIKNILTDSDNLLYTSSMSAVELLQLHRIKKIQIKKYKTATEVYNAIENEFYIQILPFAKQHTETLSKLKIADSHNDPFDHSIISHAITEQLILISSDIKFEKYTAQKLNFLFNKR